ncbi:NAD(P)-binding protein [Leucogyrophana mollusca]|uniref:NAD(P)-binding protein n=1 Tax=Leucogyrophana mollusca TaxID=85980 RepID=A0ACB8BCL5_9AGAM|nr:NAD(P)-binding protein [Leucogyrophana mollusca]
MKIIVTGASGVLGSAVYQAFKATGHTVCGLAHSRSTPQLKQLDLLSKGPTEDLFNEFSPDWVIHCAAERRPDVAEKDPEGAQRLNASVPAHLAELSKALGFTLIYISTDYVFDGTSPPYTPNSQTNPLQLYGQSKRDGELAVLGVGGANPVVLRVPVLYGPAPHNSDSAVNILLDVVQDQSGKTYKMDHYASRYPTNVEDIASFLVRLSALGTPLPPILHYSGEEKFTKFEMCEIFARILNLKIDHIKADSAAPTGAGATSRPRDCHLDTSGTKKLVGGDLGCSPFETWWKQYLSSKNQ